MTIQDAQTITENAIRAVRTGEQPMEQAIAYAVTRTIRRAYSILNECKCQNCGTDDPLGYDWLNEWLGAAHAVEQQYQTV